MFTFLKLKLLYKGLKRYFAFARGKYGALELFVTFGGVGHLKPASGTWGSLAALPFALLIHFFFGAWVLLIAAVALYFVAAGAIFWYEKKSETHDGSEIVIDEVVGMMIALTPATVSLWPVVMAFIAFRAFDALKPGPIGWIDKNMPGAHGVLLDDVLAGAAAAIVVILFTFVMGYMG